MRIRLTRRGGVCWSEPRDVPRPAYDDGGCASLSLEASQDWQKALEAKPDEEYVPDKVNLGPQGVNSAWEAIAWPGLGTPAQPGEEEPAPPGRGDGGPAGALALGQDAGPASVGEAPAQPGERAPAQREERRLGPVEERHPGPAGERHLGPVREGESRPSRGRTTPAQPGGAVMCRPGSLYSGLARDIPAQGNYNPARALYNQAGIAICRPSLLFTYFFNIPAYIT
jgi:hypothetical protein